MTYNVFGGTLGLNLAQSINQSLATRKLSVSLSVKRVDCDKTEEIHVHQIFVPHERSFKVLLYLVYTGTGTNKLYLSTFSGTGTGTCTCITKYRYLYWYLNL